MDDEYVKGDNLKFPDTVAAEEVFAAQREITAKNALIENIFVRNRIGHITISYEVEDRNRIILMQVVTLVTGRDTRIRDQFGNRIGANELRRGMVVNASFSSAMTRSIPPQARAFSIVVIKNDSTSLIEEGRVVRTFTEGRNGYILTGVPNDPNRQMRYSVSRRTELRDREGNRITLRDIRPGQIVRIERASFQTASIPPQTSALTVQILSGSNK